VKVQITRFCPRSPKVWRGTSTLQKGVREIETPWTGAQGNGAPGTEVPGIGLEEISLKEIVPLISANLDLEREVYPQRSRK